jgi:predicted metal-dependent hydrolase
VASSSIGWLENPVRLELVKKDPACLEYVVVHEMAHLLERGHGERFTKLMDSLLPDWRARRDRASRVIPASMPGELD